MPKELENKLMAEAAKKHLGKERANAYVYGTMRSKTGWKPGEHIHKAAKGMK